MLFDPVLESRTDEPAKRLRQPLFFGSGVHEGGVHCLRWSTSGKLFASGDNDGAVIVWELRSLSGGGGGGGLGGNNSFGLGGNNSFGMVQAEVWSPMRILRGHNAEVQDISWSPCDRLLATSSIDTKVLVWLIDKPQTVSQSSSSSSSSSSSTSSFPPGAKKSIQRRSGKGGKHEAVSVAVGSGGSTSRIVTTPLVSLEGHMSWAQGLAWDPLGRFLASAGNDKQVILWRVGFTGGTEDLLRTSSGAPSSSTDRIAAASTSRGDNRRRNSSIRKRNGVNTDSFLSKKRFRNNENEFEDDEEDEDEENDEDEDVDNQKNDENDELFSGDETTPGSRDSFAVRAAEGWGELRSCSLPYKHCTSESNVRRIDWSSDGTSIATSHAFLPEDLKSISTEGSAKGKYTCPLLSRAKWYSSSSRNDDDNDDDVDEGREDEERERREFESSTIIPTAIHLCGHIRPIVAVRSSPLLSSTYGILNKRVSFSSTAVGGMDGSVSIWSPIGRDLESSLPETSKKVNQNHRFKPTLVVSNLFSSIVTDLAWGSAPDAAQLASCRVLLSTNEVQKLPEETWQHVYAAAAPASTISARCPFLLAVSLDGTAACILFGEDASSTSSLTSSSSSFSLNTNTQVEGPLGIVASSAEVLSHLCHLYHVKQNDVIALLKGGPARIRRAQSFLRRKHRLIATLMEGRNKAVFDDIDDEERETSKKLRDLEHEQNEEKIKLIKKELEWEDDAFELIDEAIDLELEFRDKSEGKFLMEGEGEDEMVIDAVDIALFILRRQTLYGIPENILKLPSPSYAPDVPDRVLQAVDMKIARTVLAARNAKRVTDHQHPRTAATDPQSSSSSSSSSTSASSSSDNIISSSGLSDQRSSSESGKVSTVTKSQTETRGPGGKRRIAPVLLTAEEAAMQLAPALVEMPPSLSVSDTHQSLSQPPPPSSMKVNEDNIVSNHIQAQTSGDIEMSHVAENKVQVPMVHEGASSTLKAIFAHITTGKALESSIVEPSLPLPHPAASELQPKMVATVSGEALDPSIKADTSAATATTDFAPSRSPLLRKKKSDELTTVGVSNFENVHVTRQSARQSTIPCAFGRFLVTRASQRRLRVERNVIKMAQSHSDDEYDRKRDISMRRQSGAFKRERNGAHVFEPWIANRLSAPTRRHSLPYPTMMMPPPFAYYPPFGPPGYSSIPQFTLPYSDAQQLPMNSAYSMMMMSRGIPPQPPFPISGSSLQSHGQTHGFSSFPPGPTPQPGKKGENHGIPINVVGGRAKAAVAAAATAASSANDNDKMASTSTWPQAPYMNNSAAPLQSIAQVQPHQQTESSTSSKSETAVSVSVSQQLKRSFCGVCGSEIKATFCTSCGTRRED